MVFQGSYDWLPPADRQWKSALEDWKQRGGQGEKTCHKELIDASAGKGSISVTFLRDRQRREVHLRKEPKEDGRKKGSGKRRKVISR